MVTRFPVDQEVPRGEERRSFGSIERRSGHFRARYVGPVRERYDAPHLFGSTPGSFKLKSLEPDQIRRWYSTVLSADRPVQRKHAYSLLRSILSEGEGPIDPASADGCRHRDVGIPPHLIAYLAKYVAALPVIGRDGFLFPGQDGAWPMSERTLRYTCGKARKVIAREDLTFQDMRRSAASLAAMIGGTTAELKAMMGHATAGMVERYQHATAASRSRLAENMSKLAEL